MTVKFYLYVVQSGLSYPYLTTLPIGFSTIQIMKKIFMFQRTTVMTFSITHRNMSLANQFYQIRRMISSVSQLEY